MIPLAYLKFWQRRRLRRGGKCAERAIGSLDEQIDAF
jgi:hypothetical protein